MQLPKQFYYKNNRLQQLRGFLYTVQTGSISKAATKMGLSQSAITLQIQSLERDLKTKLFDREKKKVRITKAGQRLYEDSIPHIYAIDGLFRDFISNADKKISNTIKIAANHASISYILPKYIKFFKDNNPQVKFKINNLTKEDAINRLMDDEIDFFLYPQNPDESYTELDFIEIASYQPILLIDKNHPLASKNKISLTNIAKYNLLRIEPKFVTLPGFEEVIRSSKMKSDIDFEMADWEILKKFVKSGLGVAIISSIILENEENSDLIGKDISSFFPKMTYGILLKKGRPFNDTTKSFINMLRNEKLLDYQKNK